jgi:hypothetical protein
VATVMARDQTAMLAGLLTVRGGVVAGWRPDDIVRELLSRTGQGSGIGGGRAANSENCYCGRYGRLGGDKRANQPGPPEGAGSAG